LQTSDLEKDVPVAQSEKDIRDMTAMLLASWSQDAKKNPAPHPLPPKSCGGIRIARDADELHEMTAMALPFRRRDKDGDDDDDDCDSSEDDTDDNHRNNDGVSNDMLNGNIPRGRNVSPDKNAPPGGNPQVDDDIIPPYLLDPDVLRGYVEVERRGMEARLNRENEDWEVYLQRDNDRAERDHCETEARVNRANDECMLSLLQDDDDLVEKERRETAERFNRANEEWMLSLLHAHGRIEGELRGESSRSQADPFEAQVAQIRGVQEQCAQMAPAWDQPSAAEGGKREGSPAADLYDPKGKGRAKVQEYEDGSWAPRRKLRMEVAVEEESGEEVEEEVVDGEGGKEERA
jgi:hypothetical protein